VMIQVDADILLIDEVLAVGDAAFQQKCFDEFHRLRSEGRTILLVTHDMDAVTRFCDRAMVLDRGRVAGIGTPEDVAELYLALNFAERGRGAIQVEQPAGTPPGDAVLREVWFEDEFGLAQEFLPAGQRSSFHARVDFGRYVELAGFSLRLENDAGQEVFATALPAGDRRAFRTGESAVFVLMFRNDLDAGWRYYVTLALEGGTDAQLLARHERVASMVVTGARSIAEPVALEHELRVETSVRAPA
jgi:energy-coupling factor transporter ATP-binding protein EcfA2